MNIPFHPILLLSCYNNEPFPGRLNCLPIFIVKLFFSSHFCFFLHCRPGWLGIRCKQVKDKHCRVNKQSPESQHQCQHYLGQNVRPAKYWVSPLHSARIYPLVNVDGVLVYQLVLCSLRKAFFLKFKPPTKIQKWSENKSETWKTSWSSNCDDENSIYKCLFLL